MGRRPRPAQPLPAAARRDAPGARSSCCTRRSRPRRPSDWWDDEVFLGLARLRGMECRSRYAEAFYCTKAVLSPGISDVPTIVSDTGRPALRCLRRGGPDPVRRPRRRSRCCAACTGPTRRPRPPARSGGCTMAYCPDCAYVRNVAFDPAIMVYDTTMDTNLHFSPAFQAFSAELVAHLAGRYRPRRRARARHRLRPGRVPARAVPRRRLHRHRLRRHVRRPGRPGPVRRHLPQWTRSAGRAGCPTFDVFTSRHWFEHIDDPYEFLADLRQRAGDRPVYGYLEVPGRLLRPRHRRLGGHLPARVVLRRVLAVPHRRAGRLAVEDTGTFFSGMFRFIEISANQPRAAAGPHRPALDAADRDRQLAAVAGFAARHHGERAAWRGPHRALVATAPTRCCGAPARAACSS